MAQSRRVPREVPPRRSWGRRTALVSAALLAGVRGDARRVGALAGSSRAAVLAGQGDAGAQLDADAAQIANIGDEIDGDMRINGLLRRQRATAALQGKGHCACDYDQAGPRWLAAHRHDVSRWASRPSSGRARAARACAATT